MRTFVRIFQAMEALILDDFLDEGIVKMAVENSNYLFKFLITILNQVAAITGLNISIQQPFTMVTTVFDNEI